MCEARVWGSIPHTPYTGPNFRRKEVEMLTIRAFCMSVGADWVCVGVSAADKIVYSNMFGSLDAVAIRQACEKANLTVSYISRAFLFANVHHYISEIEQT